MTHDPAIIEVIERALRDAEGHMTFEQAATAALDAIEAAGCVVVPREPTQEMIEQGAWEISSDRQESALAVYKLMVAARPGAQP